MGGRVVAVEKKRSQRAQGIIVTVTANGRGSKMAEAAEFVKREVATALANIGAFHVAAAGEFSNGNGVSLDPERMRRLSKYAAEGLNILVEVDD